MSGRFGMTVVISFLVVTFVIVLAVNIAGNLVGLALDKAADYNRRLH